MPHINIHISASGHALDSEILPLDVASDLSLADLKAYVGAETGLDPSRQQFYLDGRPLTGDQTTLDQAGVKEGDMLAVMIADEAGSSQNNQAADQDRDSQIEATRQRFLSNPAELARVRLQAPDLASVIHDPPRFAQMFRRFLNRDDHSRIERERQMQLLNEDPFNIEAQQKIEELIRQENVNKNLEDAYEQNPESFGDVTMLYINASVNGHTIKVLVDSGAQTTVMSPSCAEACNIMRLIDKRYAGIARGVGTAKILGRVHFADLQINDMMLPCSFMVMEGKTVDLLLGLDMLKRYQVSIDLKKNRLIFPTEEVEFLAEADIPKWVEEERAAEPTVPGPDGTEIGTESGIVRPAGSIPKPSGNFGGAGRTLGAGPQSLPQPDIQPAAAAAPSSSRPTTSAPPTQAQMSRYPKASIDHLTSLGFSQQEAISALDATDGNVEYAAGLLFGA